MVDVNLSEGDPTEDTVSLSVVDTFTRSNGVQSHSFVDLTRWESYSFDSNFLEPTDYWSMTVGGKENPPLEELSALVPGATVKLYVGAEVQATGYVTSVHVHSDPRGGRMITVNGTDVFGPVVAGGADPYRLRFKATQTLEDLVTAALSPFGFTDFLIDDSGDRQIKTGLTATRFTKKKGKPLKRTLLANQLKPLPNEGVFQYVAKILKRSGLWIWPGADGLTVIVSTPDYDQAPVAKIVRQVGTNVSNVLSGGVSCRTEHQPSVILATGYAGGGDASQSPIKVAMVNELTAFSNADFGSGTNAFVTLSDPVNAILALHSDARLLPARDNVFPDALARPQKNAPLLYKHDDESRTSQQLENFVRHEMGMLQKEMWVGEYVVKGHTYDDGQGGKIPWTVNTVVDVDDDLTGDPVSGFHGPMWVCGRTFEFDRKGGGTRTRLHLILPHTLEFLPLASAGG